ncbi:hypothetical protein PLESTB_001173100 [Pleodorina starrii]|uniref:Uncharacterized protein n=1 Tax=Pleodorina starrii TaxID=330485 RepID=A0A9W6BRB2_9CHLO|nr:hypothetical protein PLESTM_000249100 [Pleodorina starrii]GLC57011.1 hypothetical protein PLESTB_001173100 [Pleodorina starrii]GLC64843.1 hypothetical protein PLESTF_000213300 [Pleodorina starrii]
MSLLATRQQAGASSSCRPAIMTTFRLGRRARSIILCASSGSSGSSETFVREARTAASRAFKQAKGKWDAFAKEQRLEERANKTMNQASASAREAADKAKEKARRAFVQLDSEYELSAKAARAVRRAEETARDIDQTYGVRRRLRSARDYLARSWPTWQRQFDEFGATWYGKITIAAALCLLLSSPLFWGLLNVLLLLWWLCVPLAILMLNAAREAEARRLQEQEAEAARRAANPFAELFRDAWGARATGRGPRAGAGGAARRGGFVQQDGPVIDAEWVTIDEADGPGGSNGNGNGGRRRR